MTLALVAACGGSGSSSRLRSIQELPPSYRELWTDWVARTPDWGRHREALAADAELRGFFVDNLMRRMLQSFGAGRFTRLEEGEIGEYERSRGEILRHSEEAVPRLVELYAIGNGHASEIAAGMLEEIGRPAVVPVAALLARDDAQARRRAADLLGRLPHAREHEPAVRDALIEALSGDEEWLVRAKAALSLGARGNRDLTTEPARAALCRALGDPDSSVGVRAARGLATLDDPRAIPALINYLERASQEGVFAGVHQAQESLQRLSGESGVREAAAWRALWQRMRREPN